MAGDRRDPLSSAVSARASQKLFFPIQPPSKNIPIFRFSDLQKPEITLYPAAVHPTRGALRNVTDAGWDAVDAGGAKDERAFPADGEGVWS